MRRGDAITVQSRGQSCDYLTLALLAGVLGAGLWCAAVGVPELGGLALAELLAGSAGSHGGSGLDRLLLVPNPGDRWAQVAVAMADGVDLVLVRPPGPVDAAVGRRVDARLRQGRNTDTRHTAALLVLGSWPSARIVLHTEQTTWVGLDGSGPDVGTGHLTGGLATIVARGRATGGQTRSVQLWLPAADGTARSIDAGNAANADTGGTAGTSNTATSTFATTGTATTATATGTGTGTGTTSTPQPPPTDPTSIPRRLTAVA